MKEGDVISVTAPAGDFYLDMDSAAPVVLIGGGVGLTPMMSMLNTLVAEQPQRQVTYIHAAISSRVQAFGNYVRDVAENNKQVRSFFVYQDPTDEDRAAGNYDKEGYVTLDWMQKVIPSNEADFYFCGPPPFMNAVNRALKQWGVPADRIHYEFFGAFGDIEYE